MKNYKDLKIVIDGKTYDSVDELPESVRKIVGERISEVPHEPAPREKLSVVGPDWPNSKEPETLGNRLTLVMLSVLFIGWILFKLQLLHA